MIDLFSEASGDDAQMLLTQVAVLLLAQAEVSPDDDGQYAIESFKIDKDVVEIIDRGITYRLVAHHALRSHQFRSQENT